MLVQTGELQALTCTLFPAELESPPMCFQTGGGGSLLIYYTASIGVLSTCAATGGQKNLKSSHKTSGYLNPPEGKKMSFSPLNPSGAKSLQKGPSVAAPSKDPSEYPLGVGFCATQCQQSTSRPCAFGSFHSRLVADYSQNSDAHKNGKPGTCHKCWATGVQVLGGLRGGQGDEGRKVP